MVRGEAVETRVPDPIVAIPGPTPAASTGTRMRIGMDDPSLAPHLERTALDGQGGSALTYLVEVESSPETAIIEEGESAVATEAVPKRAGVRPFFKVLLGISAGLAAGWALVFEYPVMDFMHSVLVAVGLAVVVSWMGLRWKRTSR